MEDWKRHLSGGFGFREAPFAVHPRDHERAELFRHEVIRQKLEWKDIVAAAREHLAEHAFPTTNIEAQVERVRDFLGK